MSTDYWSSETIVSKNGNQTVISGVPRKNSLLEEAVAVVLFLFWFGCALFPVSSSDLIRCYYIHFTFSIHLFVSCWNAVCCQQHTYACCRSMWIAPLLMLTPLISLPFAPRFALTVLAGSVFLACLPAGRVSKAFWCFYAFDTVHLIPAT
jgi:hypothetical protein